MRGRGSRYRAALAAVAVIGSAVSAQPAGRAGYVGLGEFDVTPLIEPAPSPGDPRYEADRAIFRATRAWAGSERYALATRDVETGPAAMLRIFSCAIGVALTPDNVPRLAAVAHRAALDTGAQVGRAKELFRHQRPYVIDPGPTCQAPAELLDPREDRASYDYPSGHSAWGWTWALVLAGAAPDRAQHVLERGRAYGNSRVVCGVHNASAVEAGMLAASATMAAIQTTAAYQADLADARQELDAVRHGASDPPAHCETEARLVAQPVLAPVSAAPSPP